MVAKAPTVVIEEIQEHTGDDAETPKSKKVASHGKASVRNAARFCRMFAWRQTLRPCEMPGSHTPPISSIFYQVSRRGG
jgi:hypothetical protein